MAAPLKITVEKPCHEAWNKMAPADKGRFCSSCQKTVVDFTQLSDKDLLAYFSKHTTNTCGRFNTQQLNRAIEDETRYNGRFVFRFFSGMALFLGLTNLAYSQKDTPAPTEIVADSVINTLPVTAVKTQKVSSIVITGKVFDKETKEPILGATVIVKGEKIGAATDINGEFKLFLPVSFANDTIRLETQIIGYTTHQLTDIYLTKPALYFEIGLDEAIMGTMGEIIVVKKPTLWQKTKQSIGRFFRRVF